MPEIEAEWLPGYENAQPVRIGNAAPTLPQLGMFGDVLRARLTARSAGLPPAEAGPDETGAADTDAILSFLESRWPEPDAGLWEMRGPPRQFTHTKAMIWAAADSAVKMIESFGDRGPVKRWRRLRSAVRADVLERGYDPDRNTFTQHYGSAGVDASLLRLPPLGFLPAADPRMRRHRGGHHPGTGRQWRAAALPDPPAGRHRRPSRLVRPATCPARSGWPRCSRPRAGPRRPGRLYTALLGLRNDVGLLAEGYDPLRRRFTGNHPLAGSHIGLIMTARALTQIGQFAPSG